ncbi:hypothetical protein FACS189487_00090 [Campylobacterota bacterium]|nr:hypothetical protein FACS189487_00090 [Campylobacterota bacterium]
MQWNLAGASMGDPALSYGYSQGFSDQIVDAAVKIITQGVAGNSNRATDVAMLNEVCTDQVVKITDKLVTAGYVADGINHVKQRMSMLNYPNICGGGDVYDVVVSNKPLAPLPIIDMEYIAKPSSQVRRHGLLCVERTDAPIVYCVTHLVIAPENNPQLVSIRNAQLSELYQKLEELYAAGKTVVMGGDFNAKTYDSAFNSFFSPTMPALVPGGSLNIDISASCNPDPATCTGHYYDLLRQYRIDASAQARHNGIAYLFVRDDKITEAPWGRNQSQLPEYLGISCNSSTIDNLSPGSCSDQPVMFGRVSLLYAVVRT